MGDVRGLTPKERKYIEEFALTSNAKRSYLAVYGKDSHSKPYDILNKPEAQEYLNQLRKEQISKWGESADAILSSLLEDALYLDENGKHSPTWQKSVDLAQKQLGLQSSGLKFEGKDSFIINIVEGDQDA